jgi:hypothetical protein
VETLYSENKNGQIYMKHYSFFLLAALACGSAGAQNQYDAATFATGDLNGTARYVGMGGALGALGGDVSTMSSNRQARRFSVVARLR